MRPFKVVFVFVIVSIMGLLLIPTLPVDWQPDRSSPQLSVTFSIHNASPSVVEQKATSILENAFSKLPNLKHINSKSRYNQGQISLSFSKDTNIDLVRLEVASLIRQLYPQLQQQKVSYPQISNDQDVMQRKDNTPILTYSINAPFAPSKIHHTIQQTLVKPLSMIDGVKKVQLTGSDQPQIILKYDLPKLLAYHITTDQIQQTLSQYISSDHIGTYQNSAGQHLFVKLDHKDMDLEKIKEMPLGPRHQIKDVASVYYQDEAPKSLYRINAQTSVRIVIYPKAQQNQIDLSRQIKSFLSQKQLPKGYTLFLEQDNTAQISQELDKIYLRSMISIGILVLLMIMVHRSAKALVLLLTSILVNIGILIIVLKALHLPIHLYTLAGITISLGMIIDNAVVMYDHLRRWSNHNILLALIAATLTTTGGLSIVFVLPESERYDLSDFCVVMIINLLISLLVAWLFTPALFQLLYPASKAQPQKQQKSTLRQYYTRLIIGLAKHRKVFNIGCVLLVGLPTFLIPHKVPHWDQYNALMRHPIVNNYIMPGVDLVFGGTLRLFKENVFEHASYRGLDKTTLYVSATLAHGSRLEDTDQVIQKMENFILSHKEVDKVVTEVLSGEHARLEITFKQEEEGSGFPLMLKSRLIQRSYETSGVKWEIYGEGKGYPKNENYFESSNSLQKFSSKRIKFGGYDHARLKEFTELFAQKLSKSKRVKDINTHERLNYQEKANDQWYLDIDVQRMQYHGVTYFELSKALGDLSINQSPNLYVKIDDKEVPILLEEKNARSFSTYDLQHGLIFRKNGEALKVNNFGTLTKQKTKKIIQKKDRQYISMVGFQFRGGPKSLNKMLDATLGEMSAIMPSGYWYEIEEPDFGFKNPKNYYMLGLLVIIIFMLCSILFEDLKRPFLVIMTIPISFVGLFLIFYLGDFYFDQGGYAAFILLGGLVVNASIFIIHSISAHHQDTESYNTKLLDAVWAKASPILIVTISTILGLVPMLSEGNTEVFWFSLGIGTIGGLLMSLIAVFVCLPVWLYKK